MQTLLTVVLIWITPSVLYVAWRLWVTRPLRDAHRRRAEYTRPLAFAPRGWTGKGADRGFPSRW